METAATAATVAEQPARKFGKEQLKAFIERVERLEEEKKAIADDIRDVYAEAKGSGFDVKALRAIAAAQAGYRRAQGTAGDPGNVYACARHGLAGA